MYHFKNFNVDSLFFIHFIVGLTRGKKHNFVLLLVGKKLIKLLSNNFHLKK